MDDQVIPDFNRPVVVETVIPQTHRDPPPAAPVYLPTPVVYAPPPRMEQPGRPPGDLKKQEPNNPVPISTLALGDPVPVQSNNLAPDISTYVSSNEPYFQLSSNVGPDPIPDTWYEYPTQTGSVLFDNTIPVPAPIVNQGNLHALGGSIFYNANSLMPSTWYLNPALNGEVLLVDASGTQLLHSIDANLYYNNELLAKANDIQDIADWSLYPALATVELAGQNITQVGSIDASGGTFDTLSVTDLSANTIEFNDASGSTLTVATLTATDLSANSILFGDLSGGAITVTGGINTGISGIITGGIATNGVGPVTANTVATSQVLFDICGGTLTSPDGTILTFNGQAITTGTEGDAANWANYPAITTVSGLSTAPLALQAGAGQQLTLSAPGNSIVATTGGAYNVTVDKGINIVAAANVDITAQNGAGGNIALNAQPGYQLGTQQVGFGAIQLNAYGSSNQLLGLGGKIDINAYSGGLGEYGSATSRVSVSSATIALSAGAAPTLPGTAGAMNIFGQDIVSIVASLIPPVLPQFPQTVYIYGDGISTVAGGVRLSSPNGVQIADNSEFYATDIFPYTSNGLNLKGRASFPGPAADVTIEDCASITMRNAGTIADVQSITMTGSGIVSGVQSLSLTGTAGITGVATINGVAYPPPVGDVADWSTFPAKQNVDISGYEINNVNNISMPANGTIISAGQLSIFADTSGGNLNLATNGGGNVNIGTGNAGDIFIETVGAGNNLSLAGDTTTVTAPVQLNLNAPIIDVYGADVQNVSNITNEGTNLLTVQSTVNLIVSAETNLTLVSDSADVTVQGQTGVSVYAATGNVNLTADSGEVIVQDSALNMNTHKITNLTAGTAGTDAVNLTQLTFRDSTEFYVSSQGSNANNGSILAPFLTIQAAITAAEAISSAALVCVINVASGHYTENLTFNKGYVVLNGTLQSQTGNEVCEITGSISIACAGANDVFNRQVTFQGFNITCGAGQSITDTSTSSHTVTFQDCKCSANSVFFNSTTTAPDMRFYLTNVEVSQTSAAATLPVISTNVGLLEFERLDMTIDGNAIGVLVGGTSVLSRFSLSTLESTNTAATLLPLLSITSTTTSTHSFGNIAFAFTSATAKTATNAVYINSGINTAIIMLNNVFTLTGTASSTNFTVGYNGVGSPAILGVNNTSLNIPGLAVQTTAVQPGITQIAYTDINPPNMACYSTTGDQSIAAVNTPQAVTFNTTQFQQGTALVASSRFYVTSQGNYQITWSLMLSQGAGTSLVTSFLKKNGTTVANTGSQTTTLSGSNSILQVSPNFILSLNAGDYVEVWVGSNSLGTTINSTGATNGNAATPGAVFNITQIR